MKLVIWERIWGNKDWNIIEELEDVDAIRAGSSMSVALGSDVVVKLYRREGKVYKDFRTIEGQNVSYVSYDDKGKMVLYLTVLYDDSRKWYHLFGRMKRKSLRFLFEGK